MSDDIVIQLKDLASTMKRGEGRSTVYGAVSEIERLRAERLCWLNIAFCTHCLPQHDHYCAEHLQEKR